MAPNFLPFLNKIPHPLDYIFDKETVEKRRKLRMQEKESQEEKEIKSGRPSYVVNTLTDDHDQLRALKDGEYVFDERRGKWYRVKKVGLPSHLSTGPLRKGDPEDKFLRHIEKDVVIADEMAKRIEKVECRETYMNFVRCMRSDTGDFIGKPRCKPILRKYYDCKLNKFRDPEFRQRMYDEYLAERGEYRRIGLSKEQREFKKYLEWKAEMLEKQMQTENYDAIEQSQAINKRPRFNRD